jgi:2-polyprenyl-3-methyl-5-hydroxy-6-metoxy-1,4-benzoquinol methylase
MDREKARAFLDEFTTMAAGATTIGMLAVADRAGLLQAMANGATGTPAEIAEAAGLNERYTEEILGGLHAAGVLGYDPATLSFSLAPEQAAVVADDSSPYSMTGWLDMIPTALLHMDAIVDATRTGGGVHFDEFGQAMLRGIDRANRPSMEILLTRRWLTTLQDITDRLIDGGVVADVGCGSGAAVGAMANAFGKARVLGFDTSSGSIERARASTDAPNASFVLGGTELLQTYGPFDLVTMIDVVHDLPHPVATLSEVRTALKQDGALFIMEPLVPDNIEDRVDPKSALTYGISLFHCMTQSLAVGGAGLGATLGSAGLREVCTAAGFKDVTRLPIDNPFSAFYRVS